LNFTVYHCIVIQKKIKAKILLPDQRRCKNHYILAKIFLKIVEYDN